MGSADIQALVSSAERAHRLPTRHAHISEAISALVRIDDNLPSPEDLQSMIAELTRIVTLLDDGELKGVSKVVELLDNAHDACDDIGPAKVICDPCKGSSEGAYSGLCMLCHGHGEVDA